MILSRYCIRTLSGPARGGVVVPEATLVAEFARDDKEKAFRERLAMQLARARVQRQQARARDRRLAAHRRRRQQACASRLYSRAQKKGAQSAMQWLCDERRWEEDVYRRAVEQVCSVVAEHLQSQLPELNWAGVLESQLTTLLTDPCLVPPLRLRVPAGQETGLRDALADYAVQIESLPDAENGYALLENDVVRVRIPLAEQLTPLIAWLRAALSTGEDNGRG